MAYLVFVLRRAIIIAASATLGTAVLLCVFVVMALHTGPTEADRDSVYFLGALPDENVFDLFAPHHFHLRHDGHAVHSKSS
jgi:hypothetical protein